MEITLFWISVGLFIFGAIVRQVFKKESLLSKKTLVSALHIIFMAAVGALVGFVFSASMDLHGPSPRWPIVGAIVGLLWGIIQISPSGQDKKSRISQLLAADLEWVETSFSAVLLAAVIMYSVVQAFKIPSGSMEDTLLIGDHLFVSKFVYGIRIPFTNKRVFRVHDVRRGEVVVFECPDAALSQEDREHHIHKDFIKRAIGLPGDTIQVKDKHVYLNGRLQNEPYVVYKDQYIYPPDRSLGQEKSDAYQKGWEDGELAQVHEGGTIRDNFGPITVPPNSYFVMGDNRDGSFDSRFWGPVPNRLLKGKAWIIYWPLNRIHIIR